MTFPHIYCEVHAKHLNTHSLQYFSILQEMAQWVTTLLYPPWSRPCYGALGIAQSGRSTIWWRATGCSTAIPFGPDTLSSWSPCEYQLRATQSHIHGGWNCSSTVVWRHRSEFICCSHFNMNDLSVGCDDGEQQKKHSNHCVACVHILYAVVFRIWLTI